MQKNVALPVKFYFLKCKITPRLSVQPLRQSLVFLLNTNPDITRRTIELVKTFNKC